MATKNVPIKDICITAGTQMRPVDDAVMLRYKALIADGYKGFPPVSIISDGKNFYLYDGFHRYFAYLKLDKKYIEATVESGTLRDAVFLSFNANLTNAFPRQVGTVGNIIRKMLADAEWAKMPLRGIADWTGCTERYVRKIQAELKSYPRNCSEDKPHSKPKNQLSRAKTRTVKRGDSEYEMKTLEKKVLDSAGKQVPKHLITYFERANEYRQMIKQLNDMLKTVRDGKEAGDLFYKFIKIENLTADINNVKRIFRFAKPYAICGFCGGDENNEHCRACGGCGFVNELTFKATPEDLK